MMGTKSLQGKQLEISELRAGHMLRVLAHDLRRAAQAH
jgi:hypothetical protein